MTTRWGESGNIFFTLFGAIALVGVVGAATSTLMRGPVGTVVSLNQRAKADSQMQIAMKLAILEAQQRDTALGDPAPDCDNDALIEPMHPGPALPGLNGGGQLPSVGSTSNDPWGVAYGYCGWDHGTMNGVPANEIGSGCADGAPGQPLLDGVPGAGGVVLAVISAGPDRQFGTTCVNAPAANAPYITRGVNGADDIITEMTYAEANEASGGLWYLKSGNPDEITTGKALDVQQGAQFTSGNVGFTGSNTSVSFDAGVPLDLSGGGLFLLPTDDEASVTCSGVADRGLLRRNTNGGAPGVEILEICDGTAWLAIGGGGAAVAAVGDDSWIQFNVGGVAGVGGVMGANANLRYSSGGGIVASGSSTLGSISVTNAANVSGAATLGSTLSVAGNTTLSGTVDIDGAATMDDTLQVTGDATFDSEIYATDGTSAVPAYSFTSDIDSGMYYSSGGLRFSIGGTDQFAISSGGITATNATITNDLTVGNNLVTNTLTVNDVINADRFISDMSTTSAALPGFQTEPGTGIYSPVDNSLAIVAGGLSRVTIDGAGDVGIGVTNPEAMLDVGGEVKIGTSMAACGITLHGAIRYVSGDVLQVCSSLTNIWETIGTSGGGGGGASDYWKRISLGDPRLYYTDDFVGVGTNDPLATFHVNGDFLNTGTYTGTASAPVSGAGTRMFFDVESGAFRAGRVTGTQWNSGSIGVASIALGSNVAANAAGSIAIGSNNSSSNVSSISIGSSLLSSGTDSIALGRSVSVNGNNSAALGLGFASVPYPDVTGNSSFGIFMGDQSNIELSAYNTMALLGGRMIIDQLPAPFTTPSVSGTLSLDVEGGVGAVQYCDENGVNCFTAQSIASGMSTAPGSNREILFNSGGVLGANPNFVFSSADNLELGGTGAIKLPVGNSGNRPASPTNGMIRYNTANGKFEGYQNGAWQDILTTGGGGIAINDLSDAIANYTSRNMYLGQGNGDDTTTGIDNTSLGNNALAVVGSGVSNTAIGSDAMLSNTSGQHNVAIGYRALRANTIGSINAFAGNVAIGSQALESTISAERNTAVGTRALINATGSHNTALGGSALGNVTGGAQNIGIGISAGDLITLGSANIMIGVSANPPANNSNYRLNIGNFLTGDMAGGLLAINGTGALTLPVGQTATRPASPVNGMLRYNSVSGKFEGYQGGAWQDILTSAVAGGAAAPDRGIQFNSGGNFAADSRFIYSSQGVLSVSGTYSGTNTAPLQGAGTRMYFDPAKSAFRAGTVNGAQWNYASTGNYSTATGYGNIASGDYSTAIGYLTTASGSTSTALGVGTIASGGNSIAIGSTTLASGSISTAMGAGTTASGNTSTAMGAGTTASGNTSTAMGAGTTASGNTSTAMGAATTASGNFSTAMGKSVTAGNGIPASSFGDGSMALGLIDDAVTISTPSQVRGIQSYGIFMGDQDGLVMTANNTMGLFGGQMVIDPNVPATQLAARSVLDLGAATDSIVMPAGTTAQRPVSPVNGMIRYNSQTGKFEGYQGGAWNDILTTGGGVIAINDLSDAITNYTSGSMYLGQGTGDNITTGFENTALGNQALDDVTSGTNNTAIGHRAMYDVTTGQYNVAIGSYAYFRGNGSHNTAIGEGALFNYTGTGQSNTVIGRLAMQNATAGADNTVIGAFAGSTLSTGTSNIVIGHGANVPNPAGNYQLNIGDLITGTTNAGLLTINGTGALTLPIGQTATRPASPVNGMLRYNSVSGKFEGYQGGAWQDILTSAVAGGAAAPDRGIQFNSGGNFAADSRFIYSSQGVLSVSGTYSGTNTAPIQGAGTRMYFDPAKSAFRAGSVTGAQWDYVSTGNYSTAFGRATVASGIYSTAMGLGTIASAIGSVSLGATTTASGTYSTAFGVNTIASGNVSTAFGVNTIASGNTSTAMGAYTTASGMYSTSLGSSVVAGNGTAASGFGDGSIALGLIDDAVTITTPSQVRGIQSYGVFMGDQDGLVMTANNTMGLFGGQMVIDPNVPATQLAARSVLDLGAATDSLVMPRGTTAQRPASPVNGMIRYNSQTGKFEGYQGGAWNDILTTGGGAIAINDLSDAITDYTSGSMYLGQGSGDSITTAYRNTALGNAALDVVTSGYENTAIGNNTLDSNLSGIRNTAIGSYAANSISTGGYNVAIGNYALQASNGSFNTAIGDNVLIGQTSGAGNTAIGRNAMSSATAGSYNTVIGESAGLTLSTGGGNIIIGRAINVPSPAGNYQLNIGDIITGDMTAGLLAINGTGALTLPVGQTATRPASPVNGMLRYNSVSNKFEGYQAGSWVDLATGGPAGAASPDRGIQFNSGGSFAADSNFVYSSVGSFMVSGPHTGIATPPVSGGGSRMYFDPSMSALRAGGVGGSQWDATNIGISSIGLGYNTIATGNASVALGSHTTASGSNSLAVNYTTTASGNQSFAAGSNSTASGTIAMALGTYTNASGLYAMAFGRKVTTGNGIAGSGFGDGSVAFGLVDDAITITTNPEVRGIQSYGIFMGNQDGLVMTANNTMGLFGGQMVIDPRIPAQQLSARGVLDLGAATDAIVLPLGATGQRPGSPVNGMLRYNSTTNKFEGYQNSAWVDIIATAGAVAIDDLTDAITRYTSSSMYFGSAVGNLATGISNTALGSGALQAAGSGSYNTAYGTNALSANTTGTQNVAIGAGALVSNVIGTSNTAIGNGAMATNLASSDSIAIGVWAMRYGNDSPTTLTTGNTALGNFSQRGSTTPANNTGSWNTSVGYATLFNNTSGTGNAVLGFNALNANTTGGYNTVLGYYAGSNITTGSNNIMIGNNILAASPTADYQLNIGNLITGTTNAGLLAINGTGALTLPIGQVSNRPVGVNGMLRYNSVSNKFEGYQAGSWVDLATGGPAGAASPDRGIQFNSGGSFAASSNLIYSSMGAFMISGTYTGTGAPPTSGAGSRMTFDPTKSSFRAGQVTGTQWDNGLTGQYSVAMGYNTTASNNGTIALGTNSMARGDQSVAIGAGNVASGIYSLAMGRSVTAGNGTAGSGLGDGSIAFGLIDEAVALSSASQVQGIQSFGIFMGDQDGLVMSANNTMGLFGGQLVIDPRVPAQQLSARAVLDLGAATDAIVLPLGATGQRPGSPVNGMLRYNSTTSKFEGYQAGSWVDIATGSSAVAASPDRGMQFNSGGTFAASSTFVYTSAGNLGLGTATPQAQLDIAGTGSILLPRGDTSQRPTAVNGMIRYNSQTNKFEAYQASAWVDMIGGGGSTSFLALSDTPSSYAGEGGKYLRVNAGTTAVEFTDEIVPILTGQPAPADIILDDLGDVVITSPTSTQVLTYNGTNWVNSAAGSGGTPGAPDRGIQFNSGGNFAADANFAYSSQGVFTIVGTHTGVGASTITGSGTRMFFDPTKSAFRAGTTTGAQMDNVNIGPYSASTGYNTRASGQYSTATGYFSVASGSQSMAGGNFTQASGQNSTAIGYLTISSGITSTAMGRAVTAGNGTALSGFGDGSMALGLIDDAVTITTNSQVSGIQSYGIFMGDQDGLVMTANNTMGLFGGTMVIDPRIPAQQLVARSVLDLGAATDSVVLPSGTTAQRPGAPVNGMIRYNSQTSKFEGYQGGSWQDIVTGAVTTTFLALSDTPASYAGEGGKYLRVNAGATAVEFTDEIVASVTGQPAPADTILDDLGDVVITTPTNTQVLTYNGTNWVNAAASGGGGAIDDLTDAITNYTSGNMFLGAGVGAAGGGSFSTAFGSLSLQAASTGASNTAIGRHTLNANTVGANNTAVGTGALQSNVGGSRSTAIGVLAMRYANDVAGSTSVNNTAVGYAALQGSTTAANNTGMWNTAVGSTSMTNNTSGQYNSALGYQSLQFNTIGNNNTAIGYNAMVTNVAGGEAVAIGRGSMEYANSNGSAFVTYNTALGAFALRGSATPASNTGIANTAVGHSALFGVTSGNNNVSIGDRASDNITTGSNNITIGSNIDVASATGNYQLNIGNSITGDMATGTLAINGTGALTVPAGQTGTRPAGVNGMIRYNSTTNKFEGYQNSTWVDMVGGSGGTPATPDRGIQFNSGGAFAASSNLVYSSQGVLSVAGVFTGINTATISGAGTRMYYDPSKSAFRAGNVTGAQWDYTSTGNNSTAFGYDTVASGGRSTAMGSGTVASASYSTAMGDTTIASGIRSTAMGEQTVASGTNTTAMGTYSNATGNYATAMGYNAVASGDYSAAIGVAGATSSGVNAFSAGGTVTASGISSIAMGRYVTAGNGIAASGFGDGSMALGLMDDLTVISVVPQVQGIQSLGVFMGDQDGLVMTAANTMGLFGGRMIIDPKVPATQLIPRAALDVGGATDAIVLPLGSTGQRPTGVNGMIRYNSQTNKFEGYQNSTWVDMVGGSGTPASPDRGIQYNSGGTFAADSLFTYTSAGNLGVGTATPQAQLDIAGTGSILLPRGSTAQRPTAVNGMIRYNSTTSKFEAYQAGSWIDMIGGVGATTSFLALADTPSSYAGEGGKYVRVNAGTTALEFTDEIVATVSGAPAPSVPNLDDLGDVSASSPTTGQSLVWNGALWAPATGAAAPAGGSTTQIQYNSGGNLAGSANFTWTPGTSTLTVAGLVDLTGTGTMTLPRGTTAQRPGSPVNGMIRYNNQTFKFEGYQAGAWVDMITAGGSAASPDRGIQFNSGGTFAADSNFVYSSSGALMVSGTYTGLTSPPASGAGTRMYFDPGKSVFRAGTVNAGQWDFASTGNNSVALGRNTTASGDDSIVLGPFSSATGTASTTIGYGGLASGFRSMAIGESALATSTNGMALGFSTTASGLRAQAFGSITVASGSYSTALGKSVVAGNGVAASGFGDGSMALGLIDELTTVTTPSQVRGDMSYGIFMGDQDGLVMTANNTMGLFGGQLVIDPKVPATQLSARGVIDVGAATDAIVLPYGATGQRPGSPVNGMIRYNSTTAKFEGYQAGSWVDMITAGSSAASPDRGIQFNSGGTFAAAASFTYSSVGYLGVNNSAPDTNIEVTGGLCVSDASGDNCTTAAGTIRTDGSVTANAFDLAERYPADTALEPGTIVALDSDKSLYVREAQPTANAVVGIVSTDPGLVLGWEDNETFSAAPHVAMVALSGRVPLKVTGEGGAIKIGDRIALSTTTAGHGTKATEKTGTIVGIALESFAAADGMAKGTITVFVQTRDMIIEKELRTKISSLEQKNVKIESAMNDIASDIQGLKAHTGYGINKAGFGPGLLAGMALMFGFAALFFFVVQRKKRI